VGRTVPGNVAALEIEQDGPDMTGAG